RLGAGLPPYGAVPCLGALGGSRSTALALAFAAPASDTPREPSWVPLRIGKTKFPWKPRSELAAGTGAKPAWPGRARARCNNETRATAHGPRDAGERRDA